MFARTLPHDGAPHGDVHASIRFAGGPRPARAFCGAPITPDHARAVTSPFRGMAGVMCADCSRTITAIADHMDG